jgi:hypothetical protein
MMLILFNFNLLFYSVDNDRRNRSILVSNQENEAFLGNINTGDDDVDQKPKIHPNKSNTKRSYLPSFLTKYLNRNSPKYKSMLDSSYSEDDHRLNRHRNTKSDDEEEDDDLIINDNYLFDGNISKNTNLNVSFINDDSDEAQLIIIKNPFE